MVRRARRLLGSLAVLLASACTGCTVQACTAIGGIDGVSVRLDEGTAERLANGRIHLCIDDACSDQQVPRAGTAMVQTCDQGHCADSTIPQVDNTHFFFPIGDPSDGGHTGWAGPGRGSVVVVVLHSFDRIGRSVMTGNLQVDLQDTYLNGRGCGVTSKVGNISVTAAGVSVSR